MRPPEMRSKQTGKQFNNGWIYSESQSFTLLRACPQAPHPPSDLCDLPLFLFLDPRKMLANQQGFSQIISELRAFLGGLPPEY